jgi:hypothetical protein
VTGGSAGEQTGVTTITLGRDDVFGGHRPAIELAAGTYTFDQFRPRVTFFIENAGWYASVDFVDAAALLLDNPEPAPGLDPVGRVLFGSIQVVFDDPCDLTDTAILDSTPNALIEWLQGHELLTTSSVAPVNMAGYSGLEITVSLTAEGCRGAGQVDLFPVGESRFYLPAETELRMIVLSLPTRPLMLVVEGSDPRLDDLLESIEIDPS